MIQRSRATTNRRRVLVGGLALATTTALSACGGSEATIDDQGRVRLRFATDTTARAEHGGFYQALASGAYERRGLNVEIIQGGATTDVAAMLASGAVELGLGSSSFGPLDLVVADAPVRAVAAFFQTTPLALLAHPQDPPIASFADVGDRPVYLAETQRTTLGTWLGSRPGFDPGRFRPPPSDLVAAFLEDDQSTLLGDTTNTPFLIARDGGFEPRVFPLQTEGLTSYGALVLSPNGFARDNAEALRGFLAASAEGWRDYIKSDPAPAHALIRRANTDMSQAQLDRARIRLRDDGIVDGGDAALFGLGTMTQDRWQAFFDSMIEAGVYAPGLNWQMAFTDAYLPGRR